MKLFWCSKQFHKNLLITKSSDNCTMRRHLNHTAVMTCIWQRSAAKQLLPMQFAQLFYQKYCWQHGKIIFCGHPMNTKVTTTERYKRQDITSHLLKPTPDTLLTPAAGMLHRGPMRRQHEHNFMTWQHYYKKLIRRWDTRTWRFFF